MKSIWKPLILVGVFCCLVFAAGCWKTQKNPVASGSGTPETLSGSGNASVRFHLVLPGGAGEKAPSPSVRADGGATPLVTFKLILVNPADAANPTTTLTRVVGATASGTAVATFTGLPARTVIGDVHIEGGHIGSFTDFQGTTDLAGNVENVLYAAPKGSQSREDIAAEVIRRVVADPLLLAKVPVGLASAVKAAISSLSSGTATVYDAAVTLFSNFTDPGVTTGLTTGTLASGVVQVGTKAIVRLPEGSSLSLTSLTALNNISRGPVQSDGITYIAACVATGAPVLTVVANSGENAVLLKLWVVGEQGRDNLINASSTAEALVLFDPQFLRVSPADFARARTLLAARSDFPTLIRSVEAAVLAAPSDPFSDALFNEAGTIAQSLFSTLNASPAFSIRESIGEPDPSKFVCVEDDQDRSTPDVTLVNRSFCHYNVTIKKNGTIFKTPGGNEVYRLQRSTPTSNILSWPPEWKELVPVEGIGEGELSFQFAKQSGLSLFDGLMSLAGTVVGAKLDSMEELDEAFKLLAASGEAIRNLMTTALTTRPNSVDEGVDILKALLWEGGSTGFQALLSFAAEVYKKKIEAEFESGWLKFVSKAVLKKVVLWGTLSYSVGETAAILYSIANSPDEYQESGQQTKEGWYGDLFEKRLKVLSRVTLTLTWICDFSATVLQTNPDTGEITTETAFYDQAYWNYCFPFTSGEWPFTSPGGTWTDTKLTLTDGTLEVDLASRTIKTATFAKEGQEIRITIKDLPFYWYGNDPNAPPDENLMVFKATGDNALQGIVSGFAYSGAASGGNRPVAGNGVNVQSWTFLRAVYGTEWKLSTGLKVELSKP